MKAQVKIKKFHQFWLLFRSIDEPQRNRSRLVLENSTKPEGLSQFQVSDWCS
jgi:hypothetical protein